MGTRIVSGIILGGLTIVVVAHGGVLFFVVALALGILGINEFYRITRRYRPLPLAGFVSVALLTWAAWYKSPAYVLALFAFALLLTALLGMRGGPRPGATVQVAVTLLGILYVGFGLTSLLLIRHLDKGSVLLLTVVFGTWAGDTVAYFTGRFFGATPMAPRLSPRKTWEGFAGGALGTILLVEFIGSLYSQLGPGRSLLLGLVIAVVGPIGDLFESLLKRDVGVKDAGRFMPGHGGVLDRFDALIFAGTASYFLFTLALHL